MASAGDLMTVTAELYSQEQNATYPSEQEKSEFLAEFYAAYEQARAKEHSLANRMLGGATIALTGAGGQMLASALAEQNVDSDAERAMNAYLSTFRCDYGVGKNIKGGQTNITLPGAADLIPLYTEYVALANDLKLRKQQLGLKPGIESETILESSTTGLYDDVPTESVSGVYASLARAIKDPDGEDAKKLADLHKKSTQNKTAGAVMAGGGVTVGGVGNVVINHTDKERQNEILTATKTGLENAVKKVVGKRGAK